jgi:hypothetical protein
MIARAVAARTEVDCRMMRDPRQRLQCSGGIKLARQVTAVCVKTWRMQLCRATNEDNDASA